MPVVVERLCVCAAVFLDCALLQSVAIAAACVVQTGNLFFNGSLCNDVFHLPCRVLVAQASLSDADGMASYGTCLTLSGTAAGICPLDEMLEMTLRSREGVCAARGVRVETASVRVGPVVEGMTSRCGSAARGASFTRHLPGSAGYRYACASSLVE